MRIPKFRISSSSKSVSWFYYLADWQKSNCQIGVLYSHKTPETDFWNPYPLKNEFLLYRTSGDFPPTILLKMLFNYKELSKT